MGFFSRRRGPLPADIATVLAASGRYRWASTNGSPDHDPFVPDPIDPFRREFDRLDRDGQRAVLAALGEEIAPLGGWAVWGAWEFALATFLHEQTAPGFNTLFDAALAFQRDAGVPENNLSPMEAVRWKMTHPGETWLVPREPPSRATASITPLQPGEERQVAKAWPWADSLLVFVTPEADGRVRAFYDGPVERDEPQRGRTRWDVAHAADLYELYDIVGQNLPLPPHESDPEFEPFLRHPKPRI
ncbi:MAG: hypothetical protein AAGC46_00775 [Solirubrobacteraceae bacterium]|nr:hypothetical protein [Patulibacter sp.]